MTNIGIAIIYLIKLTFMSGKSSKATSVANVSKAKSSPKAPTTGETKCAASSPKHNGPIEVDLGRYCIFICMQHFILDILDSKIHPIEDGYMIIQDLLKKDSAHNELLAVAYEFLESENPDIDFYKDVIQDIVGLESLSDHYASQMRFASTIVDLMSLVDCISQNIDHFKKEIEYLPQYSK